MKVPFLMNDHKVLELKNIMTGGAAIYAHSDNTTIGNPKTCYLIST
jgi:hypothetical protein